MRSFMYQQLFYHSKGILPVSLLIFFAYIFYVYVSEVGKGLCEKVK